MNSTPRACCIWESTSSGTGCAPIPATPIYFAAWGCRSRSDPGLVKRCTGRTIRIVNSKPRDSVAYGRCAEGLSKVSYPLGDQVAGYVSITRDRIWLLFVDSTRKPPVAPSLTDAEAVAMMKSHVAWTGKYSTEDQTPEGIKLTSHVDTASSQAIAGTERVYFMSVEGNRLTMKSPGVIVSMTGKTSIVEIELVKAN